MVPIHRTVDSSAQIWISITLNSPALFREELTERSNRLVEGARALAGGKLSPQATDDLIRDAHTIKGSASLVGHDLIARGGAKLEDMWREVAAEGRADPEMALLMEAMAGAHGRAPWMSMVTRSWRICSPDPRKDLRSPPPSCRSRHPMWGVWAGLLTSVSDSLLSGGRLVSTPPISID